MLLLPEINRVVRSSNNRNITMPQFNNDAFSGSRRLSIIRISCVIPKCGYDLTENNLEKYRIY